MENRAASGFTRAFLSTASVLGLIAACSSDSEAPAPSSKCEPGTKCAVFDSGAGGLGTGGSATGGRNSVVTGGRAAVTGGRPSTGGSTGSASSGADASAGGVDGSAGGAGGGGGVSAGGALGTGGVDGSVGSGGTGGTFDASSPDGSSANGGTNGTGGVTNTGGVTSTGGLTGTGGANGTGGAASGNCTGDGDCPGGFCRVLQTGGHACVPFSGEGDRCGGFVPPFAETRCEPNLDCVEANPLIADAPGTCAIVVTVGELLAAAATYDGHHIAVLEGDLRTTASCTRIACGPQNPCCNTCTGNEVFADTPTGGTVTLADSQGQPFACAGTECALTCTHAAGKYRVIGIFRAASVRIDASSVNVTNF